MTNVRFETIEEYKDIETLNMYREKATDGGEDAAQVMNSIYVKGRDNALAPIQWDDSEHAGFTDGTPWHKVNPNYKEINAKQAMEDPSSVFHYYRKLIQLRKENEIIVYGTYHLLLEEHPHIYAYSRTLVEEKLLVILNFSGGRPLFEMPEEMVYSNHELMISNYVINAEESIQSIELMPYEARVHRLK